MTFKDVKLRGCHREHLDSFGALGSLAQPHLILRPFPMLSIFISTVDAWNILRKHFLAN